MFFLVLSSAGWVWKLGNEYWSHQEILSNLDVRTALRSGSKCFEPRTCSSSASARDVLVCASLGKGKGFGVWVGFHAAYLVPGMKVLVIANFFPENRGIYNSVSTLAGPAVCGILV